MFQRLKLDGPRIEVGLCNESYVWVPILERFVKLQEVGVLSYSGYFVPKGHLMAMGYSPNNGAGFRIVSNKLLLG